MAQVLNLLPCEVRVVSSEMTPVSRLPVNWSLQAQLLDNCSRSQVEVSCHDPDQVLVTESLSHCAITVHKNTQWL